MKNKEQSIVVDNISKCYRIGFKENINDNLSTSFINFIKSPLRNFKKYRSLYNFNDVFPEKAGDAHADYNEPDDVIWALRNISFGVQKGEVVGIIGRNGAGKSTLLKVLSKITTPTRGRATIRGRISSLLEVGTGFHPELTGKENIYLNGTILGMRKHEVDRKFDEIVSFSGVEKFLNTPVKRYSSGMRVRLAFSVAAHLEPEILIIDEVLAVGDAEFQKKCLTKMENVGQSGRTVLFVSHNMPAITRLCSRTLLMDKGGVLADGPSHKVVRSYLQSGKGTTAERTWPDLEKAPGDDVVRLCSVKVCTEDGIVSEAMDIRRPVGIQMVYEVLKPDHILLPFYNFYNEEGLRLFSAVDMDPDWRKKTRPVGRYKSTAWIPGNLLVEGTVYVGPAMKATGSKFRYFYERDSVAFQTIDPMEGDSVRGEYAGNLGGVFRPKLNWETDYSPAGSSR